MNNSEQKTLDTNFDFLKSILKPESAESTKKTSSFYDDYVQKTNQSLRKKINEYRIPLLELKPTDQTQQTTDENPQYSKFSGSAIKKNIEKALSKKYGELDTKHIFDGIDDKDVEDNIQTAENTIRTNIDRGVINKSTLPKLPNLRDGLALSYAAAEKGKNKAATRAREAAYMEKDEPLIKSTKTNMLSTEPLKPQSLPKTTAEKPTTASLMGGLDQKPKPTNAVWKPGEKTSVENFIYKGKNTDVVKNAQKLINNSKSNDFTDNIQKLSNTTAGNTGFRLKAWMNYKDNEAYNSLKKELTETDLNAGIKVVKSPNDKYYYDYTEVIMKRLKDVLPEFSNHKIMSYPEYYKKYSNWIYEPSLQDYYAFCLKDYVFFYDQVNHGAPWDIKRDDPWKQQFGDIKMPYYDSNEDKDEEFLFRGELVTREDLGNILYGYLGSAMGIGDTTLYQGAGVAASWTNIFNGDLFDASAYYGDNPHDYEYVKKGIELFYEDYPNSKT